LVAVGFFLKEPVEKKSKLGSKLYDV
jgi:hypothetical protein